MAGLTLFFRTAEEFYTWAKNNIPEFISNGGAGAINNDISTVRSFSEANLTTAKGRFSIAQGVAQFINTERDLEQLIHYYNGDSNLASKVGKNSALWGGVQVVLSGLSKAFDDDPFTHPINDLEAGDLLTAAATGLAFVPGGQPLAAIITVGALVYNVYSYATGKIISLEELVSGSHHDALWAFVDNQVTQQIDKLNYDKLIFSVGGDSVARWIFDAYVEPGVGKNIDSAKYQEDLSLLYSGVRDRIGTPIIPPRDLRFMLLNTDIQHTLNIFKHERDSGHDMAKGIIHALKNLNPLALANPSQEVLNIYNNINVSEYSDEWILARAWMLLESLPLIAENRQDGLLTQLFNPFDIDNAQKQLKGFITQARRIHDIDDDAGITFESSEKVFEIKGNGVAHRVVFKHGNQAIEGGNNSDLLFGTSDADVFHAGAGNDTIFAEGGNDEITGGSGRNLLNGGEGRDFYYFNTADGDFDDTIIDSDGKGQLKIDGESLLGHFFDPKEGAANVWTAKIGSYDWQAVLTDNGDLILHTLQGNHRISIPGWKAMGDRGLEIILREYNSTIDPSVNMTLLGDWRTRIMGEEYIPDNVERKYYGQYDWNHWYERNPDGAIDTPYGVAEKDFDDVINGMRTKVNKLKIYGFGGDDALGGSEGNDYIYGGEGRDLIAGAGGKDLLDGGAGDDFIYANSRLYALERILPNERWKMPDNGIEEIFAGRTWGVYKISAGEWRISGIYQQTDDTGDEGDSIFGGSGSDRIYGSNLGDYIYGDRNHDMTLPQIEQHGNDDIVGLGGDDIIEGNGGDDTIYGDGYTQIDDRKYVNPKNHGQDTLAGGYGNDGIIGGGNDDTIYGGAGDDELYGDQGIGIFSESEVDYLSNEFQGVDTIYGGSGNDKIMGGGNGDKLHGGAGNDRIWGDYGRPKATSRAFGNDKIWGDEGEDEINGGYGIDTIYGGAHNDILRGGAGVDYLYGDDGNDDMYGDGDYCPPELEDMDYMEGGSGNDAMSGCGGDGDELHGGDGDDKLYGKLSYDKGDDGVNHLFGEKGEDLLIGAGNTDYIYGGEDNDELVGYAGDDYLWGNNGEDKIWGDEGRTDLINPYGIAGEDHISGGAGNDYLDGGNGRDIVHGDEGDDIVLGSFGNDDVFGDDGDDNVAGDAGDDHVYGGDGDDHLWGDWQENSDIILPTDSGSDHLFGGRGDDQIDGGYGDDELHGDEGNDLLYANAGNDTLLGGEGNDELNAVSGTNRLFGDEGDDILHSGTGDDYLNGGLGNDVYYFKRDFGHDIIDNNDRLKGRFDYIHFLETRRDEVEILRENDDLVIRTLDGAQQVTVFKHFSESEPWHFINAIRFADDGSWHSPHHLVNHPPEVVRPLDNLAVKADSDIGGQIALDAISDPDGEPLTYQLTMSDGIALPEWLQFDAQTGAISGHAPADSSLLHLRLTGTDHAGASAFTDFSLQVNAAPKVAHSLEPHRAVEGQDFSFQLPSDTFVDPESDPLNLQLLQSNGEALPDWLHFDAESGTVSGNAPVETPDLSLSLIATDPLGNQAHANFSLALTEPPQTVKTSWRGGTIHGKDGDDHLVGSNFNDRLYGEDGNDYLKAKFGNDVLDGGKGNDRMEGDWGNDEYRYRAGDGHDTIHDSQGKDTLILDGIRQSDTRFLLRGKDLLLEFHNGDGSIVIENHAGSGRMEHFRFADANLDHRAVDDLLRQLGNNQHGVI